MHRLCLLLVPCALLLVLCGQPGYAGVEPEDPPDSPAAEEVPLGKVNLTLDAGGHTARIEKVLFTPDGKHLLSFGDDHSIRVWDAGTWQTSKMIYPPGYGRCKVADLSPDGRLLAVAGRHTEKGKHVAVIYLFGLPEGRLERVLLKGNHTAAIEAVVFSRDGKWLASSGGEDGTTRIWDLAGNGPPRVIPAPAKHVLHGHAFSPDGRRLARVHFGSGTKPVWQIIDLKSGKVVVGNLDGSGVVWSPDGKTLATRGNGPIRGVRLWEPDGKLRFQLLEKNSASSVTFAADGRTVLVAWRAEHDSHRGTVFDVATGKELVQFNPGVKGASAAALSPDGRFAVTTASGPGGHDLFVWTAADGKLVKNLAAPSWVTGSPLVAWSADGKAVGWGKGSKLSLFHLGELEWRPALAKTAAHGPVLQEGPLSLKLEKADTCIVLKDGQPSASLRMGGETITVATFVGKDRVALAGSRFKLYDAGTGKPIRNFRGHAATIRSIAPSPPNARYLVSLSRDQTLRIWDPNKEQPLLSLYVSGRDWIVWTEKGYYAASPGGERLISWKVDNGIGKAVSIYPAARFHKSLYRPDVIKRVLEAGSVAKALALANDKRPAVDVERVLPPQAAITAPAQAAVRVGEEKLQVKATAVATGGQPVRALQLVLDGRPYEGDSGRKPGTPTGKAGEVEAAWEVRLAPGVHRLRVLAHSDVSVGNSDEVEITFTPAGVPDSKPNLYVLAVGINKYPGGLKLQCAVNDATRLQETLDRHGKPVYGKVETKLLTDQAADRKGILAGLDWLKARQKAKDVAVIFYAGHGVRDQKGQFYLLPQDGDSDDLATTAVSGKVFRDKLVNLPGRLLVLLDACNSGAVGGITDDLARVLVDDDCGVVVMCAATGTEESREDKAKGHGYFTLSLIEGLEGKASRNSRDGAVYLHHLQQYVIDRVQVLSDDAQHPVSAVPMSVRSFALAKP